MSRARGSAEVAPPPTHALVVYPAPKTGGPRLRTPEACLEEAIGLAAAIDLQVVAGEIVPLARIHPSSYLGKGAVERLAQLIEEKEIGLAVVDGHLSPVQQRNLEKAWGAKVIDRTGLILEIFGARARTREGRLQVELASLSYQKSRLVRSWTHLERQRGGFGFMGGPGETQIEADRRQIGDRIARLKKELEEVKRTRELHRKSRRKAPYPVIALVGYTNAGKSTLFNRLTKSDVYVKDQLFATLDPTMRRLSLPSGMVAVLSDTVGFVSDLPHELVAAFRATLEEVLEAEVILHVRDISHPDADAQGADVENVLKDLGLSDETVSSAIEVRNKIDRLTDLDREAAQNAARRDQDVVALSAITGEGIERLLALLDRRLSSIRAPITLKIPLIDGAAIAWLYRHGEVLERTDDEKVARLRVLLSSEDQARFAKISATN